MYQFDLQIRVRYAETDQMGFVYYGNYATYFEVARVELLRSLGVTYKSFEEMGVMMPITEYSIKYIKPAYYDDLLTIRTTLTEMPGKRIFFHYETYNEANVLLNKATTHLAFISATTKRPIDPPEILLEKLQSFFS
ncbi:MAG: acyl-CoA thioesterase [Flavobacteriales bacterium]